MSHPIWWRHTRSNPAWLVVDGHSQLRCIVSNFAGVPAGYCLKIPKNFQRSEWTSTSALPGHLCAVNLKSHSKPPKTGAARRWFLWLRSDSNFVGVPVAYCLKIQKKIQRSEWTLTSTLPGHLCAVNLKSHSKPPKTHDYFCTFLVKYE